VNGIGVEAGPPATVTVVKALGTPTSID
jgi:hypothetical protein